MVFVVLERIRKLPSPRQVPATISIGIGENTGSVKDVSERARAALDIALGRGGDQVCIMDGEAPASSEAIQQVLKKIRAFVLVWLVKPFMN